MNLTASYLLGLTGGAGVAAQGEGGGRRGAAWCDAMVRIRGPFACGLQKSFVENRPQSAGERLTMLEDFPP